MKQRRFGSSNAQRERFARDGFLSPVRILDATAAATHRKRLERAEAALGDLHFQAKVHTILLSPLELATHPRVLETVTALIGPNVLLWNATYIVKDPDSTAHVSWHQDLTYWGLDGDDQVSMWLGYRWRTKPAAACEWFRAAIERADATTGTLPTRRMCCIRDRQSRTWTSRDRLSARCVPARRRSIMAGRCTLLLPTAATTAESVLTRSTWRRICAKRSIPATPRCWYAAPMRSTTSAWTSPHPETCNPAHLRGSANSTAWSA